ncbi:helicase-associated (plasmid) [Streptomyces violaceusniger Tu 4113]|uniref:Helicase-associated n=1 Tax=Streptomyces violaceusniger (strain Tu 4113) TaxID=653045 RepID=G2PHC5_STRV4|nr:helicase-associated [Streptomyces violaceusniger Tu 4113]
MLTWKDAPPWRRAVPTLGPLPGPALQPILQPTFQRTLGATPPRGASRCRSVPDVFVGDLGRAPFWEIIELMGRSPRGAVPGLDSAARCRPGRTDPGQEHPAVPQGHRVPPRRLRHRLGCRRGARHGHLAAHAGEQHEGFPIGRWLAEHRQRAHKKIGTSSQARVLASLDPWWNPPWSFTWQRQYQQYRTARVAGQSISPELQRWAYKQAVLWGRLAPPQQRLLSANGIDPKTLPPLRGPGGGKKRSRKGASPQKQPLQRRTPRARDKAGGLPVVRAPRKPKPTDP